MLAKIFWSIVVWFFLTAFLISETSYKKKYKNKKEELTDIYIVIFFTTSAVIGFWYIMYKANN